MDQIHRLLSFGATPSSISKTQSTPLSSSIHQPSSSIPSQPPFSSHLTSQTASQLRKSFQIRIQSFFHQTHPHLVPKPFCTFNESVMNASEPVCIHKKLLQNLNPKLVVPTPIQMQAIPILLQRSSLVACAPTGSGKTYAYLLPLLTHIQTSKNLIFGELVILCPTRELAKQVYLIVLQLIQGIKNLSCQVLSFSKKTLQIKKSTNIVISTPWRLLNALQDDKICLKGCRALVIDEADKLMEKGVVDKLDKILNFCETDKLQICMFSATLPVEVLRLAESILHTPLQIAVGKQNAAVLTVKQELMFVTHEEGKLEAIHKMIAQGVFQPPILLFVQTKERAKQLCYQLRQMKFPVGVLHSDLGSQERDEILKQFRIGHSWILVTTDVLGRGIDFKCVRLVINYDMPQTPSIYIHRIGRTGRAKQTGAAVTFFTIEDMKYLRSIINVMKQSGCDIPMWLRNLPKVSTKDKHLLHYQPLKRKNVISNFENKSQIQSKKSKKKMHA